MNTADNTKLIFVTDGTCGSTCACFTLRAFEADAGLFLFMGGNPESQETGAVASFAGGSVMSFDYLDQFDLTGYNVTKFESSGSFSLAHEQVFSWNQPELTLEYAVRNTHDKINVHFDPEASWYAQPTIEKIISEVKTKIQSCYLFQHTVDALCPKSVEHGINGHVCVKDGQKTKFDSKCSLIACDLGFKLVDGKCDKVPVKYAIEKSSATLTAVGCSLTVVITILVAILVYFYVKSSIKEEKAEALL